MYNSYSLSNINLEYQEVPEEPPLKKQHVDDDSHLKVHIPGGETENVILSTEFTPQQSNLFGQLPVRFSCDSISIGLLLLFV